MTLKLRETEHTYSTTIMLKLAKVNNYQKKYDIIMIIKSLGVKLMDPTELIRKHMPELRDTYKVSRIGIFGSFARDNATESSDVDILVEFSQNVGLFHFIDLQNRLAQILNRKIDMATPGALHPIIKEQILREVLYI